MRKNISILAVIFALVLGISDVSAKTVGGVIVNEANEGLGGANIALLQLPDSVFVNAVVSSDDGTFNFDIDANNKYLVEAKLFGYNDVTAPFNTNGNNRIEMTQSVNELEEVTVTASKPLTYAEAGKLVFLPNALIKTQADAYGLLKFAPLVRTTNGEDLTLVGDRSIEIKINGRLPKEGQEFARTLLKTTPPERVKRIEVITNPGAELAASSNIAYINVVITNPDEGITGGLNVNGYYTNKSYDITPRVLLSANYGKWRITANGLYGYTHAKSESNSSYVYKEANLLIGNIQKLNQKNQDAGGSLSITYSPSKKSEIGLSSRIIGKKNDWSYDTESETRSESTEPTTTYSSFLQTRPWHVGSYGFGAFYHLDTDNKGSQLDLEADYSTSKGKTNVEYKDPSGIRYELSGSDSKGTRAKAKYTQVFSQALSIEFGYHYMFAENSNFLRSEVYPDDYTYSESINSAFVQLNGSSGRFSLSGGMRAEFSKIKGTDHIGATSFDNDYAHFMPNFSVTYSLPKANQYIMLDGRCYLMRPNFYMLNPTVSQYSETTFGKGNPDLKAYVIYDISLTYSLLNKVTFSSSGSFAPSNVFTSYTYMGSDGTTISSYANDGQSSHWNAELYYRDMINSRLYLSAGGGVSFHHERTRINNEILYSDNWMPKLFASAQYQIWPAQQLSAYVSYFLQSPSKTVTQSNYKWTNYLSLMITKRFNFGGSIELYCANLLPQKSTDYFDNHEYSRITKTLGYNGHFSLTFKYIFGNGRVKQARAAQNSLNERL